MRLNMYIAHCIWLRLKSYVSGHLPNESYAVIGCGMSSSRHHCRFLGRALYLPEQGDYEIQSPGLVRVTRRWFHSVLRACARQQHHPIIVHSHVSGDRPVESAMDQRSVSRECPAVAAALPGAAIGEIIVNRDLSGIEAHVFNRRSGRLDPVHMFLAPTLGSARFMMPTSSPLIEQGEDASLWSSRLRLAFGPEAIQIMRNCHFGVIGAGSLGEGIAAMLAKLGAELTLVDIDRFMPENERRSLYGSPRDAEREVPKTHVVRNGCRRATPNARIHTVNADIRAPETQRLLTRCDGLVIGTDNVSSRLVTSHLAMAHGIPVFDVGTAIDVEEGRLTSVRGQVMKLIPGLNLCHECAGFFDLREGRMELLNEEAYENARLRGYVSDGSIPAPSVMPMNLQFAGACVWELLRYFTGATPDVHGDIVSMELLTHSMQRYTYDRNEDGQRAECPTCSPGMVFLCGDQAPLMTRDSEPAVPKTCVEECGVTVKPYGTSDS